MSTKTQTAANLFDAGEVAKLPELVCIGVVDTDLPEGKETESEKYYMQTVKLKGVAGSRNAAVNILYRPEWLVPGFKKASFDELSEKDAKGFRFMYEKHIVGAGYKTEKDQKGESTKLSSLAGLAGSPEGFIELTAALQALPYKNDDGIIDVRLSDFRDTLRRYFRENETQKVGYILKQKTEKVATGETDDNGNDLYEYVRAEGYEIGSYFRVNDKQIKALQRRAEKNPEVKIAFDPEVPF